MYGREERLFGMIDLQYGRLHQLKSFSLIMQIKHRTHPWSQQTTHIFSPPLLSKEVHMFFIRNMMEAHCNVWHNVSLGCNSSRDKHNVSNTTRRYYSTYDKKGWSLR